MFPLSDIEYPIPIYRQRLRKIPTSIHKLATVTKEIGRVPDKAPEPCGIIQIQLINLLSYGQKKRPVKTGLSKWKNDQFVNSY
jgi:hypothetical protein